MAVVAFTFGAFGDIVSLIQLAMGVRKALSESIGASMEYQDLLMEIDSLIQIVNCVHRTMSYQGPERLSTSVENALNASLATCAMLIGRIQTKIVQYRRSLRKGGSNRMLLDSWRKIGWSLFARNEVTDLRSRLAEQIEVMNTMLTLVQAQVLAFSQQMNHDQHEMLRRQYSIIREIHQCMVQRPKVLGHTWEGDAAPGQKPCMFTDLCGHSIPIPFEFFADKSQFRRFLNFYIEGRPDRHLMNASFYTVTYNTEGCRSNFGWSLQPGAHIELWLYVYRQAQYTKSCPSCRLDYPIPEMIRDGFSETCPYCQTWFHIQPYWLLFRRIPAYPIPTTLGDPRLYMSHPGTMCVIAGPGEYKRAIRSQPFYQNHIGHRFLVDLNHAWSPKGLRFVRKISVAPILPIILTVDIFDFYEFFYWNKEDCTRFDDKDLEALMKLKGGRLTFRGKEAWLPDSLWSLLFGDTLNLF